ncbi:hypothetical protein AX17_006940 [Amanita inopinata Kibby_2008]|nr:hypothetical protein AX17_006940 [Amanita inopinata Kibby_2008]
MVVTRRVPVAPAPPSSRSASTQNVPRLPGNKSTLAQQVAVDVRDSKNNNHLSENQKALSSKLKHAREKSHFKDQRSGSMFPSFPFILFTLMSLYALSTLHPSPTEPIRSVLSASHDNLIKPYILPPLHAALTHPSIEPHITSARTTVGPYVTRVEHGARPVLTRLSQLEENQVRPLVRRATIVTRSFIHRTWRHVVVSNCNVYVYPYIQPYVNRWNIFYSRRIAPHLRAFAARCGLLYHETKPHIDNARKVMTHYSRVAYSELMPRVHRLYTTTKPHAIKLWNEVRPHICAGWRFTKVQAIKGASIIRAYAAIAATRICDARREFVDPHILRIWEKVESRSASISTIATFPSSASSTQASSETWVAFSTVTSGLGLASSTEAGQVNTLSIQETSVVPVAEPSQPMPEAHVSATDTISADEPLKSAASVLVESAGLNVAAEILAEENADPEMLADLISDVAATTHADVPISQFDRLNEAPFTTEAAPSLESPVSTGDSIMFVTNDENVDDFLEQLGMVSSNQVNDQSPDASDQNLSSNPTSFSAKQEDDTTAARRAKTATKRTDIVGRHVNWQAQLDELFATREQELRNALISIRKKAVEELRMLVVSGVQDGKGGLVIDSIEAEAGRLAKGLEGYIRKERENKESSGNDWSQRADEKKLQWEKVTQKVDEKFAEKVRSVQGEVHNWYVGIREKENEEVVKASVELKSLAEKAQADIGLDYAWLDDVTYDDWQKYHDLMRTAERFDVTARAIQNGTHAHPPVDPLIPALDALERDVQEVISGFGVRLFMLRQEGEEMYTLPTATPGSPQNPEPSTSDEPTVSILPAKDDTQDPMMMDTSHVVLGKSEEQIRQALNAAGFNVDAENDAHANNHMEL